MRVFLLAMLLVFVAWAGSAQSQKPLRLCGREFVRAVVYTCGGSRWRRSQTEGPINGYELQTGVESFKVTAEMDRVRRELDTMLPVMCCQVGCRKSDIVLLC
ncbi:relaxin-3-like [Myxocyprinus asiaticus]|uniref:relaxin-3-like n=1 Tax=Myxocyprinus asiaticus TaxID=70543 RepID=UPI002222CA1A|nr:relaxin-3-like [Myxocyprinus asiaticus]